MNNLNYEEALIDEVGIKQLCIDIMQYVENIKKALDYYNDRVESIKAICNDNTYLRVVNKKSEFNLYRNLLIGNLISFVDDYNYVIKKFKNYDAQVTVNTNFDNIDII